MTRAELTKIVVAEESKLAAGSETGLWGLYLERMRELTGSLPSVSGPTEGDDEEIAEEEVQWWIDRYRLEYLYEEGNGGGLTLSEEGVELADRLGVGIDVDAWGNDVAMVI